jgi:hypothetical protein
MPIRRRMPAALFALAAVGLLAIAGLALWAPGQAAAGRAKHRGVVLGSKKFAAPYGKGFGTVNPRTISNGGASASGLVRQIDWHRWGNQTSRGRGLTAIYKPHGGYYPEPGPIELKALHRGHCSGSDRKAYRKLTFRVAKKPNGPVTGHWRNWSGRSNLCKPGFG